MKFKAMVNIETKAFGGQIIKKGTIVVLQQASGDEVLVKIGTNVILVRINASVFNVCFKSIAFGGKK